MKEEYWYEADLVRVIDGDSIEVDLDLGFRLTQRLPVRLAHINALEMNEKGGKAAKEHLMVILGSDKLLLKTYKPKDKYGRFLADVYVGDTLINQLMIKDGFAEAYEGGER